MTYFTDTELQCRCGCGRAGVRPEALDKLIALRKLVDMPMPVTSAYRCEEHPEERKKARPGTHNQGIAFDIRITSGTQRALMLKYAGQCGFNGFGLANTFLHLDTRPTPASWTYA